MKLSLAGLATFARTSAPLTVRAGREEIMLMSRVKEQPRGWPRGVALRFSHRPGADRSVFAHHGHSCTAPGERWARPAGSDDPRDRDVRTFPHDHP